MTARWNLHDHLGYLGTWSSVQEYGEPHAANPLSQVQSELAAAWGSPEVVRQAAIAARGPDRAGRARALRGCREWKRAKR
jgi:hypothetical protein